MPSTAEGRELLKRIQARRVSQGLKALARKAPRPPSTLGISREYYRALSKRLDPIRELIDSRLLPRVPQLQVEALALRPTVDAWDLARALPAVLDGRAIVRALVDRGVHADVALVTAAGLAGAGMADILDTLPGGRAGAVEVLDGLSRPTVGRADAYGKVISEVIAGVKVAFYRKATEEEDRQLAFAFGEKVSEQSKKYLSRVFDTVLGFDIFRAEPWLNAELDGYVRQNVNLIKSIDSAYFDRVEREILAGIRDGTRVEEIGKRLHQVFDITKGRAKFIARDQAATFSGQLSELRQTAVGVTEYYWRTSMDERVVGRPGGRWPNPSRGHGDHWAREGKRIPWNKPPSDGHPGRAYNCRCTAEPIIPEFEELQEEYKAKVTELNPIAMTAGKLQNVGPLPISPAGIRPGAPRSPRRRKR